MATVPNRDDERYVPLLCAILSGVFAAPARSRPELSLREGFEAADMAIVALMTGEAPVASGNPASSTPAPPSSTTDAGVAAEKQAAAEKASAEPPTKF